MTISQRSRYISSNLVTVTASSDALPNRGNNVTVYNPGPPIFRNAPYQRYQLRQGDTFPMLANRVFGSTADWWRIADMNPQIFYPGDLQPGVVIRMPMP